MRKYFLILLVAIITCSNVIAKNDLILRIKVKVNADACGLCNHNSIKTVYLGLNDANRTKIKDIIYDGVGGNYIPYNVWRYAYVAIDSKTSYSLYWHDPTGAGWQEKVLTKSTSVTQSIDYHDGDGGMTWHSVWMNAEIETFDPLQISSISVDPCAVESGYCNSTNQCIGNLTDNIKFNLTAKNTYSNSSLWLYIYKKETNGTFTSIDYDYLGTYASSKSIDFNSISNIESYWGQEIYFRIKTKISNEEIYSDYIPSIFFKQLPEIGNITYKRYACYPYVTISVSLDQTVVENIENYKFRARYSGNEGISNIVRLIQYGTISGNIVKFRPHSSDRTLLNAKGYYKLQVFQNVQESSDRSLDFSQIKCARTKDFYLGDMVQIPSFSVVPIPIDDTEYNTTRHDRSDGQIQLIINNITKTTDRIWAYFGKAVGDPPDAWSGATAGTVGSYQNIELDGISGATDNSKKTEWTLDNFDGNARYFIYLKDADGCTTTKKGVNLFKPNPITISAFNNTKFVTCHSNNADENATIRNDGIISVNFSGGIPPYNILLNGATKISNVATNSATLTGLAPTSYNVRIRDKYAELSAGENVLVSSNPEMILSAITTDLSCFENKNGSVRLNVINMRTSNITFGLTRESDKPSSASTYTYPNLSAGTYIATVTNTDGCNDIVNNIQVSQPNNIIINATGSKIARYGDNTGELYFSISEGASDYDYIIYKGSTEITSNTTSQNATITGLYDGYYRI